MSMEEFKDALRLERINCAKAICEVCRSGPVELHNGYFMHRHILGPSICAADAIWKLNRAYQAEEEAPIKLSQNDCTHLDFDASVNVFRLLDNEDETKVTGYTAEIKIKCHHCDLPFEFIGVDAGMMPDRPMASVDGQELRAPIRPRGSMILPAIPGFKVRMQ